MKSEIEAKIKELENKIIEVEKEWHDHDPIGYSYPHWQVQSIKKNIELLKRDL